MPNSAKRMLRKFILIIWGWREEARRCTAKHWHIGEDVLAVVSWI